MTDKSYPGMDEIKARYEDWRLHQRKAHKQEELDEEKRLHYLNSMQTTSTPDYISKEDRKKKPSKKLKRKPCSCKKK